MKLLISILIVMCFIMAYVLWFQINLAHKEAFQNKKDFTAEDMKGEKIVFKQKTDFGLELEREIELTDEEKAKLFNSKSIFEQLPAFFTKLFKSACGEHFSSITKSKECLKSFNSYMRANCKDLKEISEKITCLISVDVEKFKKENKF
jgi:hypothetical protein